MSFLSDAGNATLGEIIAHLEQLSPELMVAHGFHNPHSYRGYYEDLAFAPCEHTTVGVMLAAAKSALGHTFGGYKGGDYEMTENTDCWLAEYGDTGVPIVLPGKVVVYVLPEGQTGDR